MAETRVDGLSLGIIGAGGLLLYAGIKGKSVPAAIQAVIQGQSPATAAAANPITSPPVTGGGGGAGGGGLSGAGGPPPKGSYDHAGLMQLWVQVGGAPAAANNAACHGIQESSGNPNATSPNPDGGTNVGLWQLDTPGGKGAGYSVAQLKNPVLNARVTVQATGNGRDWSAWATPGC